MDGALGIIPVGFSASLVAGAATGAGALPLLFLGGGISERLEDLFLSFAAGVMLAAAFFSLILPALDAAEAQGLSEPHAAATVIAALLLGVACIWLIHERTPHEHPQLGREGPAVATTSSAKSRRVWLFVATITLHNLPEGLAVGVAFGGGDVANGLKVATGIGLQNMPECLAVAASVAALDLARWKAVAIALASGLVEPVAGLAGVAAVSYAEPLLPWGLGFAAGAMLFIVSREIIPETHRKGHENEATLGFMAGLTVMMFLDVTLG